LEDFKEQMANYKKSWPKKLVKCSSAFAAEQWGDRENYPDLLGFCYNHSCEFLIRAIEDNNFDEVKACYIEFLPFVLFYQEYIRTDVVKVREVHRQSAVFHVFSAAL